MNKEKKWNYIARKFPKINIFLILGNFMLSDGGDGRVLHALICMRYEKRSRRLLFSYRWRWWDNSASLRDSLRLPPWNELPRRSQANANPVAARPDPNLAPAPPQQKAPFGAFCWGGEGGIRTHDLGLFLRIQKLESFPDL